MCFINASSLASSATALGGLTNPLGWRVIWSPRICRSGASSRAESSPSDMVTGAPRAFGRPGARRKHGLMNGGSYKAGSVDDRLGLPTATRPSLASAWEAPAPASNGRISWKNCSMPDPWEKRNLVAHVELHHDEGGVPGVVLEVAS